MNDHPARPPQNRDSARSKAQSHFEAAEARTTLVRKMMDEERRAADTKTAKLRALRLAKEEADREAGVLPSSEAPEKPVRRKKA